MRYVLIPMACLAILPAACGKMPGELREYVQQDGDWGWGNGTGCKDRTDCHNITSLLRGVLCRGNLQLPHGLS